jgi:capsular exopolysaccharide synthesis family protein
MTPSHKFSPASFATPEGDDIIDLKDLIRALWNGKIWIIGATVLLGLLGVIYAYMLVTPIYQASTVIILETEEQQIVDLTSVLPGLGTDTTAINSEAEVLQSRSVMKRVVESAGLLEDPEFNPTLRSTGIKAKIKALIAGPQSEPTEQQILDSTISNLLEATSIKIIPSTYVIEVTVKSEGPRKAAALADQIAEEYITNQLDVKYEATRKASTWLTDRVAELKVSLEDAESRVAAFSANSTVVSSESVQLLDRQLKDMRDRQQTLMAAAENAKTEVDTLEAALAGTAQDKIEAAEDTRLLEIYEQDGAGRAFDTRYDLLLSRAKLQYSRMTTQVASVSDTLTTLEADISEQNQQLIELQQLTREAEASRLLYEYFLSRLKETSAQEGIQQANSRVLSNAVVPSQPTEPRKNLIVAAALMLGMFAGSAGVLLRESAQNSYRLPQQLEAETGLPVMGQIPLLPVKSRREGLEYLAAKPTSAAAEAIRNLRTSVLLSNVDNPPKVIMSTSSLPGEGKTTISFSLAQNLIGMGKKVLLVEGDIRRLVFSQYLDEKDAKGLISVLSGDVRLQDAVLKDPIIEADVLVSEPSNVNAADLLSSDRFQVFLKEARELYDVVIIDTPPVLVVPDARVVAQHVDAVLFTVHWDKTTKTQVQEALRMFESVGVHVNGLVLNQINAKGMKRYGYGENYGAYGSYGKKYYTE